MNKKAIKIDLSVFFNDERKMTCVLLDPNWKSVSCLQKRVEFLFDVDSVQFLSDGYFLPPQESIEIVKFCNDLQAFVPKESLKKREQKGSKRLKKIVQAFEDSDDEEVRRITNGAEQPIDESIKKRKLSGKPSQAKRSKNCNSWEITSTSEQISQSNMPILVDELKNKKKSKKSKISTYEEPMLEKQSNQSNCTNEFIENSSNLEKVSLVPTFVDSQPKKQYTLTTMVNEASGIAEITLGNTCTNELNTTPAHHSTLTSSTFLNVSDHATNSNNPFKRSKPSKTHIFFNESSEVISPAIKSSKRSKENKEPKTIVIFRCPLNDVAEPQKPRTFHLEPKNVNSKQIVEIKEHVVLLPNNLPQNTTKDTSLMNESEEKQSAAETSTIVEKENSSIKNNSINNASIDTESITVTENDNKAKEVSAVKDLKVTNNDYTNVTHTHNECQNEMEQPNETSVDCVDLSLDEDEGVQIDSIIARKKGTLKVDDDKDNYSSSDVEEIEIINLSESGDTTINNIDDIKVDKILPFSTDMTDLPKIGDIILFKIPFANKKKQCAHTNYLAGKAEYINRRTKTIKILIIDGATDLCHVPRQFICNLDDSQDSVRHVQLKLSDMLEPKLFSTS